MTDRKNTQETAQTTNQDNVNHGSDNKGSNVNNDVKDNYTDEYDSYSPWG